VEKRFSLQNDSSLSREEKLVTEEIALKEQQLSRVRRGRDNVHASINALRATLDDTPRRMAILENKKMLIEEEWQRAIHRLSTVENVVQLQHIQRDVQAEIRLVWGVYGPLKPSNTIGDIPPLFHGALCITQAIARSPCVVGRAVSERKVTYCLFSSCHPRMLFR